MALEHDRLGTGPPLVLLHGAGSRRQIWAPVLTELARTHRVIAPDLPGHGETPLGEGEDWTLEGCLDAVEGFFDELGLERPHVVGHSLGASLALELARRGTVSSATAISPVGFWNARERAYCVASLRASRALARSLRPHVESILSIAPLRALFLGQMFGRPLRLEPAVAAGEVLSFADSDALMLALDSPEGYEFEHGEQLQGPVTVAWGDRDYLTLSRQANRARRRIPQANHVTMRGCGHVPLHDDPQASVEVIRAGAAGS